MKRQIPFARKVLTYLLTTSVILVALHLVMQFINITVFDEAYGNFYEATNRLDFDDEASIPTWFSQLLYLGLAALAGIVAYIERKRKSSYWVWASIFVLGILGSIDEVSTIHETGLQGLHLLFFDENAPSAFANAWIIVLPIILISASVYSYKAYKVLPQKTTQLFIISALIYISGAVGVDILSSAVVESSLFVEQGILVALEEFLELAGLSLAIYTTLSYIEIHYKDRFNRIASHMRP